MRRRHTTAPERQERYQDRACLGKVRHASFWLAVTVAKRLERRGKGQIKVYRCRCCGAFHVGHGQTRLMRALGGVV